MHQMAKSCVLISGMGGLGVEIGEFLYWGAVELGGGGEVEISEILHWGAEGGAGLGWRLMSFCFGGLRSWGGVEILLWGAVEPREARAGVETGEFLYWRAKAGQGWGENS